MSVPQSGYSLPPRVDFGWIGQAWRLFTAQAGTWIGAVALYLLISLAVMALIAVPTGFWAYLMTIFRSVQESSSGAVPAALNPRMELLHLLPFSLVTGIVNAVLYGGLYRMALRQARGEAISVSGLFSAFDVAGPLIVVALVIAIVGEGVGLLVPNFGGLAALVLQGLFLFAPLLVVDRRAGPIQALTENLEMLRGQRWMGIFFYIVTAIVSGLGAIVCGVGIIATLPLLFLTLAVGYQHFTEPAAPFQPQYGQAEPGVWPPPPTI